MLHHIRVGTRTEPAVAVEEAEFQMAEARTRQVAKHTVSIHKVRRHKEPLAAAEGLRTRTVEPVIVASLEVDTRHHSKAAAAEPVVEVDATSIPPIDRKFEQNSLIFHATPSNDDASPQLPQSHGRLWGEY